MPALAGPFNWPTLLQALGLLMDKTMGALDHKNFADTNRPLTFRRLNLGEPSDTLLSFLELGHKETRFSDIPFSRRKAWETLEEAFSHPTRHLVVLAEIGEEPVGFLFASAGEYVYGTGAILITVNVIYTAPEIRKTFLGGRTTLGLFKALQIFARALGAREVLLHATSGISEQRTGKTIRRFGFKQVGASYVARLA